MTIHRRVHHWTAVRRNLRNRRNTSISAWHECALFGLETACSFSCLCGLAFESGVLGQLFSARSHIARTGELSIRYPLDAKPTVAPTGSSGERLGHVGRDNSAAGTGGEESPQLPRRRLTFKPYGQLKTPGQIPGVLRFSAATRPSDSKSIEDPPALVRIPSHRHTLLSKLKNVSLLAGDFSKQLCEGVVLSTPL